MAYTPLALVPVVLAHVTIVEKAFDVWITIRQGLQYALAKRGLFLLQVLVSVVVILAIALASGQNSFSARLSITTAGVGLLLSVSLGGRRLAG